MKYIKTFESVWSDSFDNDEKVFKPDSKFYKLIESEINLLLNSKEVLDKSYIEENTFENDVIGNMLYIAKYNTSGKRIKHLMPWESITGHKLKIKLFEKVKEIIFSDPEVVKYTRLKHTMKEKIEEDLRQRIDKTISQIFCDKFKIELTPELYDKYKEEIDNATPEDCLPNWVKRSKKVNLWELK